MPSDSQLQQAMHAELDQKRSVNPAHNAVAAEAGVSRWSATSRTLQKQTTEAAAGRVNGVKAVAEELKVRLPYGVKRGDGDIATVAAGDMALAVRAMKAGALDFIEQPVRAGPGGGRGPRAEHDARRWHPIRLAPRGGGQRRGPDRAAARRNGDGAGRSPQQGHHRRSGHQPAQDGEPPCRHRARDRSPLPARTRPAGHGRSGLRVAATPIARCCADCTIPASAALAATHAWMIPGRAGAETTHASNGPGGLARSSHRHLLDAPGATGRFYPASPPCIAAVRRCEPHMMQAPFALRSSTAPCRCKPEAAEMGPARSQPAWKAAPPRSRSNSCGMSQA